MVCIVPVMMVTRGGGWYLIRNDRGVIRVGDTGLGDEPEERTRTYVS